MADGAAGNGFIKDLAETTAPFEIRIIYHPVTHQVSCVMPQCDDIIRLGMLEFAKCVLTDARAQQKSPIAVPNFSLKPGQRLT
jgi:hypothetical protein